MQTPIVALIYDFDKTLSLVADHRQDALAERDDCIVQMFAALRTR